MPLAQQALDDVGEALRVHAARADPHRDVPEARRLRGPQRRPARHDRRARRLLRPRRDAGFAAGAAAGRVPVGSDALARAGARRHAADVEPARAALADRRHLGLRREAARPEWGRGMDMDFAGMLNRRRDAEAARSERGVHRRPDDFARVLPGVAARRAPRVGVRRQAGCTSCCARTARASTPTRRSKSALNTDLDQLQAGFDQTLERMFGKLRAALAAARRGNGSPEDAARRAPRTYARRTREATPRR